MTTVTHALEGDERQISVRVGSRSSYGILGAGIVIILVLFAFPLFGGLKSTNQLIDFFVLLAMAQFWNLMLGYAGILSVGQQGFVGIGAYALFMFADILHINPFISVILAGIGGAIVALPAAGLVFKLKGGYLAIGTWVVAEVLRLIVSSVERAGGGSGMTIQAAAQLSPETRIPGAYWWALSIATISIAVTYLVLRRRTGLGLKAMRDNDLAAECCGINLWRTKLYAFMIAGAGTAAAGAITAMHLLRVQPQSAFSLNWMAYLLFIVIVGGAGTIEGPIIGTIIYFVLRETTARWGEWYFILLGAVAIAVAIWSPSGIYGYIEKKTGFSLFPLRRRVEYLDEPDVAPSVQGGEKKVTVGQPPL